MASSTPEYQVGEPLRELREQRGLSVRALAAAAGFSPSFISQVENNQASPSISSLEKIVACLDVTLAEFFQARTGRSSPVVRAAQRPRIESGWSKAGIEALGASPTSRLEPILITLRTGGASGKRPHTLPYEQFALVLAGEVVLALDGEDYVLAAGDAATIAPQNPYRWMNASPEPAQLLVISYRALSPEG